MVVPPLNPRKKENSTSHSSPLSSPSTTPSHPQHRQKQKPKPKPAEIHSGKLNSSSRNEWSSSSSSDLEPASSDVPSSVNSSRHSTQKSSQVGIMQVKLNLKHFLATNSLGTRRVIIFCIPEHSAHNLETILPILSIVPFVAAVANHRDWSAGHLTTRRLA